MPAGDFVQVNQVAGLCVTEAELDTVLIENAYTDLATVEAYLTEQGFVPGPHFSGSFLDLTDVPEAVAELSVAADGSLAWKGNPIVDPGGQWVGEGGGASVAEVGSNVYTVSSQAQATDTFVACEPGDILLGGGCWASSSYLRRTYPLNNAWHCSTLQASNPILVAHAICLNTAP